MESTEISTKIRKIKQLKWDVESVIDALEGLEQRMKSGEYIGKKTLREVLNYCLGRLYDAQTNFYQLFTEELEVKKE
jgi:uncharacterized protein YydD (DUF2326 family)